MRNNHEAVPVRAFDEQELKIAKLFAELVSELQRAPVRPYPWQHNPDNLFSGVKGAP